MSGGPSQIDLFDEKANLRQLQGTELPNSIRKGQRLTGMTARQKAFPVLAPITDFFAFGEEVWANDDPVEALKILAAAETS